MLPTFDIPLTFSLALLAFVLITAAALQVSLGLQPMSRLRRARGAIESGSAAKLPGDFPSEVQPLVDDLNKVFIVLTTFVAFTTSVFSASYIGHEFEIGRLTPASVRFYHAMYRC